MSRISNGSNQALRARTRPYVWWTRVADDHHIAYGITSRESDVVSRSYCLRRGFLWRTPTDMS